MTTVPDLHTCQPRFVLYCTAHGMCEGDEWHTWAFMAWIGQIVARYKAERGVAYISDHGDFTRWIEDNVGARSEQLSLGLVG